MRQLNCRMLDQVQGAGRSKVATGLVVALLGAALLLPAGVGAALAATRHGSWTSYAAEPAQGHPCFVAARPLAREPAGLRRDPAYVYVSAVTGSDVTGEVSIKFGFPLRHAAPVIATIGGARFILFGHGERAFVADRAEEVKFIASMRKGARMIVTATSDRGNLMRDTYVLAGLVAALQELSAAPCA